MKTLKNTFSLLALPVLGVFAAATAHATIVYISPPGETVSGFASGISVEDFNATPGTTTTVYDTPQTFSGNVGTYTPVSGQMQTALLTILGQNISGDGTRFFGVRNPDGVAHIDLNTHATNPDGRHNYFGFNWLAADPPNSITLLNTATEQSFTWISQDAINFIGAKGQGNTVTAINGSIYDSDNYYGSPATGELENEIYAFIHFYTDFYFDRVIVAQPGSSARFESDNHTIMTGPRLDPEDTWAIVPEPSFFALLAGIAGLGLALGARRRRK